MVFITPPFKVIVASSTSAPLLSLTTVSCSVAPFAKTVDVDNALIAKISRAIPKIAVIFALITAFLSSKVTVTWNSQTLAPGRLMASMRSPLVWVQP